VAIIGTTGSGQEHAAVDFAGLQRAPSGSVSARPTEEIGWVQQQRGVYSKTHGRENMRLLRVSRGPSVGAPSSACRSDRAGERRKRPRSSSFSGGNKQKRDIAVGMMSEPEVLCSTKPSAALDPLSASGCGKFVLEWLPYGTRSSTPPHRPRGGAPRRAGASWPMGSAVRPARRSARDRGSPRTEFEEAFVAFLLQRASSRMRMAAAQGPPILRRSHCWSRYSCSPRS